MTFSNVYETWVKNETPDRRSPGPQVTRIRDHQDQRSPGPQVTRTAGHQDQRSPGPKVTRTKGHRDRRSSGPQVTRTAGHQDQRSSGSQIIRIPDHFTQSMEKQVVCYPRFIVVFNRVIYYYLFDASLNIIGGYDEWGKERVLGCYC